MCPLSCGSWLFSSLHIWFVKLARKQQQKKTQSKYLSLKEHVVTSAPSSDTALSTQTIVLLTSSEPD